MGLSYRFPFLLRYVICYGEFDMLLNLRHIKNINTFFIPIKPTLSTLFSLNVVYWHARRRYKILEKAYLYWTFKVIRYGEFSTSSNLRHIKNINTFFFKIMKHTLSTLFNKCSLLACKIVFIKIIENAFLYRSFKVTRYEDLST